MCADNQHEVPVVLTIAGSDCSAGAGIQADLKAFWSLGVHGLSAVTCVVAETPREVVRIEPVSDRMLEAQVRLLFEHYPIAAVKSGVICSDSQLCLLLSILQERKRLEPALALVVDPVMVATSGASLTGLAPASEALAAWCRLAEVLTPNLAEASALSGRLWDRGDLDEREAVACELSVRYGTAVLLKGGDGEGKQCIDILAKDGCVTHFETDRVAGASKHGTGCTLSAALTAGLAKGMAIPDAVAEAKALVTQAIRDAWSWTTGMEALALGPPPP